MTGGAGDGGKRDRDDEDGAESSFHPDEDTGPLRRVSRGLDDAQPLDEREERARER